MADDKIEVTHLMGKKLDKPIIIELGTKTENKNRMETVAALFGKKIGEEFSVEFVCSRNLARCCCFKADGLFCEDRGPCETMLNNLLTGKAVIIDG